MAIFMRTINNAKNNFKHHWPLITALVILWITIAFILIVTVKMNYNHFAYALDDAYIHMSIAKNFALNGVWGVTKYEFSSSASSLLWPLLLSGIYLVTGANDLIPFILNIILGTIAIIIVYYILRSFKIPPIYNLMVLIGVIFFTPLPSLIFMGMEHILQIILIIIFVYLSAEILANETPKPRYYYVLPVLAVLLTMVRYESLILIFIVATLFMLKRRFAYSLLIMGLAFLPLAIYGVISMANGWSFLPNSLILKSSFINSIPDISFHELGSTIYSILIPEELSHIIVNFAAFISAFIILTTAMLHFKRKNTIWESSIIWLLLTGLLILIQLIFIDNNWLLRYTSYLVVMGLIAITIGLYDYLPKNSSFNSDNKSILKYIGIALILLLLLSPFGVKAYDLLIVPQSTNDIYEQQYQMALFLREYYQNDSIAANDIGAINYFADIKCLDLVGLSSNDIAQAHKTNTFNAQKLDSIANQHQVKIAIVYDQWWDGNIPSNWIKVGEWTTPHYLILGNDTISFYATSPQYAAELIKNLRAFSSRLPKEIKQNGIYTKINN